MTDAVTKIAAVILCFNEEHALPRCIGSLRGVADEILVVDSLSTDRTVEVARELGARVVSRPWMNYATQFNWGLTQLPSDTDWVIRIDADEYLTPALAREIRDVVPTLGPEVDGAYCGRSMTFQGVPVRFGGVFPIRVLRLFRHGRGQCENRWMDEHVKVSGATVDLRHELIDDNRRSLTWWTDKHNTYASREAVDLLNLKFGFMPHDTVATVRGGGQPGLKRWIKEVVYARLPGGARATAYFMYRYVLRLGFLDGRDAGAFHVLQGFWYRYLVDMKVAEVERYMRDTGADVRSAIREVLGLTV
jgi:glycosyltransferase involved in cell wall biosynthesis